MTHNLFSPSSVPERIQLPGADVTYQESLDLGAPPDEMLRALIGETPWRQEKIAVWGKSFTQPRLVAWYGDPGRAYSYSGIRLDPLPWTPRLLGLKDRIESAASSRFNSVLLNYYRDNNDSMGMHSDDEKELGPTPSIASVSLGAERAFVMKSKFDLNAKPKRIVLASGSLLLMKGDTQKNYKHGVPKQSARLEPRVNLTFRAIMQ